MDYGTDAQDIVGGRVKYLEEEYLYYENSKIKNDSKLPADIYMFNPAEHRYKNNQFYQAEQLYNAVKTEYPNSEISTTGHSLGGAEAEYVAARNGLSSVSFNAPGIVHLLSVDLQKKANQGGFEKTNVAYVNPGDGIGSGAIDPNRHLSSTYYINSSYENANEHYKDTINITIPFFTATKRDNVFLDFLLGRKISYVPITLPLSTWNPLKKYYDSIAGEGNHALKHFNFDPATGNISNPLYTMEGQPVTDNPRLVTYEKFLAAQVMLKDTIASLFKSYSKDG